MQILAAAQTAQPDYVALAIVLAFAVIVAIMAIRKKVCGKRKKTETAEPVLDAAVHKATAPGSAGEVKLYGVEPKTAAMLMAIVANKMDRPLNELRFISIKEVE